MSVKTRLMFIISTASSEQVLEHGKESLLLADD